MTELYQKVAFIRGYHRCLRRIRPVAVLTLLVLIGVWILGFAVPSAHAQDDYLIGPEDKLTIIVWGHDDLKRELPVSLEGNISFPLIGMVKAVDKTTSRLEKEIAQRLADGYIVNPQVTVTVSENSSQKFFITG